MPAAVAARAELATDARRRVGPFTFALASESDEAEIRRLLREHPLPGDISLSFEREPDTSLAASIEGDVHQTLVARRRDTGTIGGLASRSERPLFVNGSAARVGYLGQLRVARDPRYLRALVDDGFAFCRELHHEGGVPAYLVSLIVGNDAARRLLLERRSPTAPRFTLLDHLETFAIPARGRPVRSSRHDVQVCLGSPDLVGEIAACLRRNLQRYQFSPCWDADALVSSPRTRGLSATDFVIAVDHGRVIGCAALWDQRAFKQTVVRGFRPALRRMRPLVNMAAGILGSPSLPAIGQRLEFAYISHLAIDGNREDVLESLVSTQISRARGLGLDYLVTAFADRHPLQAVVRRRWRHRAYRSALYAAYWPDGERFVQSLDDRPVQPEVAVL